MCVAQELFAKLTRIASISTDMFVGRERFVTVLLMRLTETVILWLSDDQNFWGEIEQGPQPLGPLGLQQVNLHGLNVGLVSRYIYYFILLYTYVYGYVSWDMVQAVLFGHGVCDAIRIPGTLPFSESKSSYKRHYC